MVGKIFKFGSDTDDEGIVFEDFPTSEQTELLNEGDDHGKEKARGRWLTVEPVVLLFYTAYSMTSTMRTEYVNYRVFRDFNIHTRIYSAQNPWNEGCDWLNNASGWESAHVESAQAEVSYWLLIYNLVEILPAMIISPLIGVWSDRSGRKRAMLMPTSGYLLGLVVWIAVIYTEASKSYLTLAHFIIGAFGDFPCLLAICNAYLCDITTQKSRTYRMIVLGIVIEFTTGVSQIAIGFWVYYAGFIPAFWFVFTAVLLAILYIVSCVEESKIPDSEPPPRLFSVTQFDAVFALFSSAGSEKRFQLVSYLVVLGVHMMILHSTFLLVLVYVINYPLCWTSVVVGFYIACSLLLGSAGTVIGGRVFTSYTEDLTIAQVGIWSGLLGLTFIAFANQTFVLFIAAMLGSFRFLASPAMRSRLSTLADSDEQGLVLACASCVESLGNLIGPSLFNLIYSLTLDWFRGSSFLVMAALYVPLSVLIGYFQWSTWLYRAPSDAESSGCSSDCEHGAQSRDSSQGSSTRDRLH